jgi:uncharacterized protein (TIGR03382 family)
MQLRSAGPACVLAFAVTACIEAPPNGERDQHVIGGTMTPEGEYPGVGALYVSGFGAMCTGTLIAPRVVLTAAHCLAFGGPPGFTLVHDTVTSQPPFTAGMRAVPHPMFDIGSMPGPGVSTFYDIGLLFLSQDITSVAPVPLPTPAQGGELVAGMQLHLVGYGRTTNDNDEAGIMFDAMTDLVEVGTTELQISTPGNPQNCHGDSGGPALYDFGGGLAVVGVVSRSADAGPDCFVGGIDTRVDAYLAWIAQEAPEVCVPPACTMPDAAPPPPPDGDPNAPDADPGNPGDGDGGGCCSTAGGDATGSALLALVVGVALLRRRRR